MADINLLPVELAPKGSLLKSAGIIKKLVTVVFILMVLFIASGVAFAFYLNTQIAGSEKRAAAIKGSIVKLEQTEQKLFLLKDRTGKIGLILKRQAQNRETANLETLLGISSEIVYSNLKVSPTVSNVVVVSRTSSALSPFLENLLTRQEYPVVKLLSFSFDTTKGYVLNLEISEK